MPATRMVLEGIRKSPSFKQAGGSVAPRSHEAAAPRRSSGGGHHTEMDADAEQSRKKGSFFSRNGGSRSMRTIAELRCDRDWQLGRVLKARQAAWNNIVSVTDLPVTTALTEQQQATILEVLQGVPVSTQLQGQAATRGRALKAWTSTGSSSRSSSSLAAAAAAARAEDEELSVSAAEASTPRRTSASGSVFGTAPGSSFGSFSCRSGHATRRRYLSDSGSHAGATPAASPPPPPAAADVGRADASGSKSFSCASASASGVLQAALPPRPPRPLANRISCPGAAMPPRISLAGGPGAAATAGPGALADSFGPPSMMGADTRCAAGGLTRLPTEHGSGIVPNGVAGQSAADGRPGSGAAHGSLEGGAQASAAAPAVAHGAPAATAGAADVSAPAPAMPPLAPRHLSLSHSGAPSSLWERSAAGLVSDASPPSPSGLNGVLSRAGRTLVQRMSSPGCLLSPYAALTLHIPPTTVSAKAGDAGGRSPHPAPYPPSSPMTRASAGGASFSAALVPSPRTPSPSRASMLVRSPGQVAGVGRHGSLSGDALHAAVAAGGDAAVEEEADGREQAEQAVRAARLCRVRSMAYAAAVARGANQDAAHHAAAVAVAAEEEAAARAAQPPSPTPVPAGKSHRCTDRALALLREELAAGGEPVTPRAQVAVGAGGLPRLGSAAGVSSPHASFSSSDAGNARSLADARRNSGKGRMAC